MSDAAGRPKGTCAPAGKPHCHVRAVKLTTIGANWGLLWPLQANGAGMIVNSMGWIEGLGYQLMLHSIQTLKVCFCAHVAVLLPCVAWVGWVRIAPRHVIANYRGHHCSPILVRRSTESSFSVTIGCIISWTGILSSG